MKTFTRDYRITGNYPQKFISYFPGMKPCILDIEATGLDPSKNKVCLAALLVRTGNGVRITQFLAENHYEENKVLDGWKQADFVIKNMGTKETAFQQLLAIMGLTRALSAEELKEQLSM